MHGTHSTGLPGSENPWKTGPLYYRPVLDKAKVACLEPSVGKLAAVVNPKSVLVTYSCRHNSALIAAQEGEIV